MQSRPYSHLENDTKPVHLTGARRGKFHLPVPLLSPSDLSQRMKNCVCLENLLVEIFQICPKWVEVEVVLLSVSWLCNLLLQRNNAPAWEFPAAIGWDKFKVSNLHTSAKDSTQTDSERFPSGSTKSWELQNETVTF